jgi:hypothetical protein
VGESTIFNVDRCSGQSVLQSAVSDPVLGLTDHVDTHRLAGFDRLHYPEPPFRHDPDFLRSGIASTSTTGSLVADRGIGPSIGDILPTLESSSRGKISGERIAPPLNEKEPEMVPLLDKTSCAWAEEAERRYQELQRGEVTAQDSEEVFREARARLKQGALGMARLGESGS